MNDTITKLQDAGWREYPDQFNKHARMFCNRFDTPTRCACNDDKAGMQVEIHVYPPEFGLGEGLEVGMCGELPDGHWIKLKHWSIRGGIEEALALIPRMLATWEFMANYKEVK